jgi:DNA-binding ferritin-like protein
MKDKPDLISALEKNLSIVEKPKTEVDKGQIINDTEKDIEYSREKMKELIGQSSEAIEQMMALASESEHPRAFEVLSNMIKDTCQMSQDLVKLQKVRKDITQEKEAPRSDTTNNSIFVGSTAELQKFLKTRDIEDVTDV